MDRQQWISLLLVGLGGFLGANLRFWVASRATSIFATRFPIGTFIINVSGSFVLGITSTLVAHLLVPDPASWRLFVNIGVLGAYTTFSTFEYENHMLLEDGAWRMMAVNILASVLLGLLGFHLGVLLVRPFE